MPRGRPRKNQHRRAHEVGRVDRLGDRRYRARDRANARAAGGTDSTGGAAPPTCRRPRVAAAARRRPTPDGAPARGGTKAPPPQDVARSAQEDLRNDEEALGGAPQEESSRSEHETAAQAALRSLHVGEVRGRHILDCHSQRFEQRHLARCCSAGAFSRARLLRARRRCAAARTPLLRSE